MSSSLFETDPAEPARIIKPPQGGDRFVDRFFRGSTVAVAGLPILLVVFIIYEIGKVAAPAIHKYGFDLVTSTTWDLNREQFGILPEIWGTLYSSVLGIIIGSVFGVAIAIFLSQDFLPPKLELLAKNIIELLAAIPSVVYGLWGIFVVIPRVRPLANWLHENFGVIPFFNTPLSGPGMLPAALVLAIMILPTVSAISREALV